MKKIIIFVTMISLLVGIGSALGGSLNMRFKSQEQTNWCWSAASQSVIRYKSRDVQQCDLANYVQGKNYCCSYGGSCNSGATMSQIVNVCSAYGASSYSSDALSMSRIISYIDNRRPFIMGWYWTSGGGHALVGYGYSGSNYVTYWDPWQGNGSSTAHYNNVVSSSQHRWASTSVSR